MQIFYQNAAANNSANPWKKVPIQLNGRQRGGIYSDQIAWWPETKERQLRVAVEIKDIAGNAVQANRLITIQPTQWRHSSESTAQINDRPQPSRDIEITKSQSPIDRQQSPAQNNYANTQFRSPQEQFSSINSEIKTAAGARQPAPKSFPLPKATPDTSAMNASVAGNADSIVWESKTKREFSKNQTNVATRASTKLSSELTTALTTRSPTTPRKTFTRCSSQCEHNKNFQGNVYRRILHDGGHQPIPRSKRQNCTPSYRANFSARRFQSSTDHPSL